MCGTCGCSSENKVMILEPTTGKKQSDHSHDHEHHHHHDHEHGHHHHDHHDHHHHDHDHHHHDHSNRVIQLEENILQQNDLMAAKNRGYFEAKGIFALNLVSSPGSGKTAILERTLADLKDEVPFYVIEGDQQTRNDANRIAALDIPVLQINTGKGCHLESEIVLEAVKRMGIDDKGILMIENVGNLVCPSMFDLGESKRVVIISPTEGDDKPLKYPDMFHTSDICIINKVDLLPYLDTDIEMLKENALKVNPKLQFFEVSATKGTGMQAWYDWLKKEFNSN